MKKNSKNTKDAGLSQIEIDISNLLNRMYQQIISLERKVDTLINQGSARPAQHFDRPYHHGERRPDNSQRERVLHKAVCAECGKECEVPFKPTGDRPVYCKDCFAKRKAGGAFQPRPGSGRREEGPVKKHFYDKFHTAPGARKHGEKRKPSLRRRKAK